MLKFIFTIHKETTFDVAPYRLKLLYEINRVQDGGQVEIALQPSSVYSTKHNMPFGFALL